MGWSWSPQIQALVGFIMDGIAFDFGKAFQWETATYDLGNSYNWTIAEGAGTLAQLPGLVYPCVSNEKVWAPLSTILLDLYTVVVATIPPLLLCVTFFLLRFIEPKDGRKTSGEDIETGTSSSFLLTREASDSISMRSPYSPSNGREWENLLGINHPYSNDRAPESFASIVHSLGRATP